MSTLTAAGFVPPIPTTVRGSPSLIGCDASGKLLAYASGSNVVIRSVLNFDDTVAFFTEHATAVTSVRLSPNGSQCASGDQGGNLIIWNVNSKGQFNSQKYQPLSGAVKDIAWSHDSERLAVVGEGKDTCGVVLNAAMGTTMGKLTGHTKSISTVDFRKDRPFRVASGSLDSNVNFYEGPPFVFKSSTSGHQGTVTCIRFSPGHDLIASVSGSDSILIQDAKTGEKIRTVPTGHTGTVYALAWINNDSVATASADKSVRTTNIRDSTQQLHVKLGDDLGSMQLGVASSAVGLISLGLNGRLTLIDESGSVFRVIDGQNQTIKGLGFFGSTGVAVSSEGRVLVFDPSAISSASTIDQKDCDFVKTVVQVADSVVLAGSESLFTVGISTKSLNGGVPAKGAVGVAATQGVIIAVTSASALVYRDDKQVATVALATDLKPVAAAAGGSTVAIAGASSVQLFKLVGDGLEPSVALKGKHQSDVTAVAVSADGTHVATGDSTKVIFVWNAQTGEVVYENLVFHSSRINCLAFAPSSNTILASGSLDRSVIVWDLPNQKRSSVPNAHFNGTTAVVWSSANQLVTAGADYCVRFWSL